MFKFAHPGHLWLLLAVPVIMLAAFRYWKWRVRMLHRLNGAELIIPRFSSGRFAVGTGVVATAVLLLVLAWAGP
ncbi:MAG: hypothetical protein ACKOCO_16560, partial [Bacteroidota bacterium]